MRAHTSFLLLLAAVLVACQPPAEEVTIEETTPVVDLAAEADAVEAVSMKWESAAQARDLDAVMAVFAKDAVTFPAEEAPREGTAAIRANIEEEWGEMPDFSVDWETTSVTIAEAGDMAWERGTWTFDPDGDGELDSLSGEYLTIYEKIDGEWKVVADMGVPTENADGDEAM